MKKLFVIAGPSAVGKTYLAEQCLKLYPALFSQVSLYTTRQPRSGEAFVDRIFVDEAAFLAKKRAGDFFIAERFHDNWYGWESSALKPTAKHLIVNVWPSLLPTFQSMSGFEAIGLSISPDYFGLLEDRMKRRGDSSQKIAERLELIKKDLRDLDQQRELVDKFGKMFEIDGDENIPREVIPWMVGLLQTETGVAEIAI